MSERDLPSPIELIKGVPIKWTPENDVTKGVPVTREQALGALAVNQQNRIDRLTAQLALTVEGAAEGAGGNGGQ